MPRRCPNCKGNILPVWDNGATYPEARKELYECMDCGQEQTYVIHYERHEISSY